MDLGKRLKNIRKQHKYTQATFAQKLGVDHTTVSKWESNTYDVDTETLAKIADIFEVTTDYLLGRSGEPEMTESEYKKLSDEAKEYLEILNNAPKEQRDRIKERMLDYGKGLIDSNKH